MNDKLANLEKEFITLEQELADPAVMSDNKLLREKSKRHSELNPIIQEFRNWQKIQQEIEESGALLKDESDLEMKKFIADEIEENRDQLLASEKKLEVLLIPKDPHSGKPVIMEVRAGTGGDEAALFAAELFRLYNRFAELKGWKVELIEANESEIGGFKEVTFSISGDEAYDYLKFESGTHRVQRIPVTESGGRIHTSAVTVAVLPEAEETDVEINSNELRIDVFRSSGPGGQSVNTTDSAVRITHIPTGIVVSCQDEKSQIKNKAKALRVLRARLLEKAEQEQAKEIAQARKSQVGSGDRSERIRTYNFPQGRMTDHRINLTLYNLDAVMQGEIEEISRALIDHERKELLAAEK